MFCVPANEMVFVSPGAEIYQLTALGTKRPKSILRCPLDAGLASGAADYSAWLSAHDLRLR